ncbi:hypothetical protein [Nonomuraea soli]|uniref:Secreted protein n=1 Tax=Nonomuraea soli TaxID=1032476 RepID=A0A7W0CQ60_9ACTN|nr:hypothetical protein [Nonomuraea soli]MBA2895291.1 hypothetical protein [Nonomuraea soli]
MTDAWAVVRAAIDSDDAEAIAGLTLDDGQRREIARELPRYLTTGRELGRHRWWEQQNALQLLRAKRNDWWAVPDPATHSWAEAMRVAGAAALPTAASIVTWLGRRDWWSSVWGPADDVALLLHVLADRPAALREELAVRLSLRLRGARPDPDDRMTRLALALLGQTGVTPPAHEPLTLAWVASNDASDLYDDPLLNVMVPRLFTDQGVGRLLREGDRWPGVLKELADQGRLDRAQLLAGCRSRFLYGGDAGGQRFFVLLHQYLAPSDEEVAPHLRDYLVLLPGAPSNVADLAVTLIRRSGQSPPSDSVEALLYRTEGKLVMAGLTWLRDLIAADPDTYAPALAAALTCRSGQARERAVKLALKHADRFGPDAALTIAECVALLPADQGARLAACFGGEVAEAAPGPETTPFVPVPLPRAEEPPPMWGLARAPEDLLRIEPSEFDWLNTERWLDGFVKLVATDRGEVARVLAPRTLTDDRYPWRPWWHPTEWAAAMARELADPGAELRVLGGVWVGERLPEMTHGPLNRLMPLMRYAEVYRALVEDRLPPYLLATPTRGNGLIDTEVLVSRLEDYRRRGISPLPLDLRQALLRVRRAKVGTALTGEVARWLTDRPADPRVTLTWSEHQGDTRIWSEFDLGPEYGDLLGDLLVHRLHDESCARLTAVLAGHRDLAAARAATTLYSSWPLNKPSIDDLELLVSAEGPVGPGLSVILARFLLVGEGVPSLLQLAAQGELNAPELGRQLARRLDPRSMGALITALRSAAEQGAHNEVWQVMTGLLPAYLPGRASVAITRLVTFAADVAGWAGARGELSVISDLAARTRESELVRQARRLHSRLSSAA